ncbi:chitosanase [Levilactobacillus tujiorum]|uniref:Chitosanase n=1 Tax=Levilactobacillus tujiorum TaxID=2912243 RepID=A0ABX1L556_9LACO|nr:chitosanase [Levilactobacillus tujiorum]MCH5464032.1 chitosanase [Levilactobacillus tujiorum]NLR11134.1 chitosanase [Lactobacillus sp. HBUAS51387]NLR29017.1 chitosanase [Levilactobacillus tujiorum]
MRQKFGLILIGIILLVLAGCSVRSVAPGYQAHHTIKTGQLRATTFALVSSAENSTVHYQRQYGYIQDIGDGRGYTAGIIGFTSKNGDLRQVVKRYVRLRPYHNGLRRYLPALKRVEGTASHRGLGPGFVRAWRRAAKTRQLVRAENEILNRQYLQPVLRAAKRDGLSPLGQYIYYDAIVVHGPGNDATSFGGIRRQALKQVPAPSQGGNQARYLQAFLKARTPVMKREAAHKDLSRLKVQQRLIQAENYQLKRPLHWQMYGDQYELK